MSRTIEAVMGIMLVLVGLAVLFSTWIGDWFGTHEFDSEIWAWWPILLVGLSLFFLIPAALGNQDRRIRAGMVIPGALLAVVGMALLYTSLTGHWEQWKYLWTTIPFGAGLGMYAAGWIADAPAFKWIGAGAAAGGVIAYLALATAFGGEAFRLIGGVGILILGLALMIGGLARRLSRKSPAV